MAVDLETRIRAARAECAMAEQARDAGEKGAKRWVEAAHDQVNALLTEWEQTQQPQPSE